MNSNDENDNHLSFDTKPVEVKIEPEFCPAPETCSAEEFVPPTGKFFQELCPPTEILPAPEICLSMEMCPPMAAEFSPVTELTTTEVIRLDTELSSATELWPPMDFEEELGIMSQDIFALQPANWSHLDNVLTEETTIIVPTWMKDEEEDDWSPLRSDAMMPSAVFLNPAGSRPRGSWEMSIYSALARNSLRPAIDPSHPSAERLYPSNLAQTVYQRTRSATFRYPPDCSAVSRKEQKERLIRDICGIQRSNIINNNYVHRTGVRLVDVEGRVERGVSPLEVEMARDQNQTGELSQARDLSQSSDLSQPGDLTQARDLSLSGDLSQPGKLSQTGKQSQAGDIRVRTRNSEMEKTKKDHNSAERTRRIQQAECFRRLGSLLPGFRLKNRDKPGFSKQQVLLEARNYCIDLQRILKNLKLELQEEEDRSLSLHNKLKIISNQ